MGLAVISKGGTMFPVLSLHVGKDQMSEPTARIKVESFMDDIWVRTVGWRLESGSCWRGVGNGGGGRRDEIGIGIGIGRFIGS